MNITIPLSEYLSLKIGHKEYATINQDETLRLCEAYQDKTPTGIFDCDLFHIEPTDNGLYKLYHKRDWQVSLEHHNALKAASELMRQNESRKADSWEKMRKALGLPAGSIHGVITIIRAMRATNRSALVTLGLTEEEIDSL